jgi:uncharacterized protein (DUF488 family)
MNAIWTLGHSNHEWSAFEALLVGNGIDVLADIRSSPSSRYAHFNRAALSARLASANIDYVFLGRELGGRSSSGGPIDYEAQAAAPLFIEGLTRVTEIAGRHRLALMCSEHEPLECHRCLLVGRRLAERGIAVAHILRAGAIEPHQHTEERLLKMTRRRDADLFAPRDQRLAHAYRDRAARM